VSAKRLVFEYLLPREVSAVVPFHALIRHVPRTSFHNRFGAILPFCSKLHLSLRNADANWRRLMHETYNAHYREYAECVKDPPAAAGPPGGEGAPLPPRSGEEAATARSTTAGGHR
jgi:hypothetical protein